MAKMETVSLSIPRNLYIALKELAERQDKDVIETLRDAIELQFMMVGLEKQKGKLYVQLGDSFQELQLSSEEEIKA
ncbi:MAG: hypothetical protein PVG32_15770 [Anaerolineales bacterium]|jgi:hypothetical protein